MNEDSPIIASITGVLYPFIIMFGIYIIVNGHNTPGGGFQGGAILATVFIGRYIVTPVDDMNLHAMHSLEKLLLAVLILVPVVFLFSELNRAHSWLNEPYLIFMNLLIGVKVSLGLTIVVFRFAFSKDR
ncbi:MAG: sodium:proton antiporter [Spirochaetaceae bacterium]|nr:MAG: sodium:proton antiporter [Spirochaetaceae bacterium]